MHLVVWDKVCRPKTHGGLGIRFAQQENQAFQMKLGWAIIKHCDDLWVQIIRSKYKCSSDILLTINKKRPSSYIWSGIKATSNFA